MEEMLVILQGPTVYFIITFEDEYQTFTSLHTNDWLV